MVSSLYQGILNEVDIIDKLLIYHTAQPMKPRTIGPSLGSTIWTNAFTFLSSTPSKQDVDGLALVLYLFSGAIIVAIIIIIFVLTRFDFYSRITL